MNYLLVGIGGMLGSIARYFVSAITLHSFPNYKFPIGTFLVNIIGCFVIGLAASLIERQEVLNQETRLFVITGILGGFTTFSAFSAETLNLLRNGETSIALTYSLVSVGLGIAMVFLGLKCAH